jgi:hypothetical protein
MTTAIVIFAKEPHPGRIKLRLNRLLGPEKTAELCRCFILDTLDMIRPLSIGRKDVAYLPEDARDYFRNLVAPYLEISTFPQQGYDTGERLQHAFQHEMSGGATDIVVINTDTPSLPQQFVTDAFDALKKVDIVVGPTFDGGIYLAGSRLPTRVLFEDVPWGTPDVFRQIVHNVTAAGLGLKTLPPWYDVDTEHSYHFLKAHLLALSHAGMKGLPAATLEWIKAHKA